MTALTFTLALASLSVGPSLMMSTAWVAWRISGNSGWVDTIWTFGLGLIGILAALAPALAAPVGLRNGLVAAMAAIWSLRLGSHIAVRTRGITDDPRYAKLIRDWGADASSQMFWLLQKQAVVSIPLALAMWLAAHNPEPLTGMNIVTALLLFLMAVGGEALADEQLRRFRREHKGQMCDTGLWHWSRHPNYFFEWLGWLAYPFLAIDLSAVYPWGLLALGAPLCMYWLLVHVSGIPPLEEHMLARHGNAFRSYQAGTNMFFPGPPKVSTGG